MLRRGPAREGPDPEIREEAGKRRRKPPRKTGASRGSAAAPSRAIASSSAPTSPVPVASWQATTGSGSSKGRAVGGRPSDSQVAVSSTQIVVGANTGVFLYDKSGEPYPSGKNFLATGNAYLDNKQVEGQGTIFQPLIDGPSKLGLKANGAIDNFNDLRVIFDPYRKRFWIVATGFCRGPDTQDWDGDDDVEEKCGFALQKTKRRSVIALAVSVDEDLTHGWYIYWWDAAVGWGSGSAPYKAGDVADYPSIGINATTVDVTIGVSDEEPGIKATRGYPHVALFKAADMAVGKVGPSGWHLYPLFNDNGTCKSIGLRNPDPTGTCPDSLVQPTLAHPDPGASYLIAAHPSKADSIVVWKVDDLLQPTQTVKGDMVKMPFSWQSPKPAKQPGGTDYTVDMSIGHRGVPLKSVWRWWSLYLVSPDADSSGRAMFRILRLPLPGDNAPFDIPDPPNGGARQILVGTGSKQSYGWPVIEVNKDGDAAVAYTRVGPSMYASIRYNAWLDVHPASQPSLLFGRIVKPGEALLKTNDEDGNPGTTRWADLAGASVDFVNGKEAAGIWIVHEYAVSNSGNSTKDGRRALWVAKIFGKKYPDWYFPGQLTVAPTTVEPGGTLTFKATLRNGGDGAAPATSLSPRLKPAAGAEVPTLGVKLAAPLAAGASSAVQLNAVVPSDTPAGTYSLRLVVDPANTTEEYSELNNSILCDCTVTIAKRVAPNPPPPPPPPPTTLPAPALPDLVVSSLSTTGFTVKNVGDADAGAFEVLVTGTPAFDFDHLDHGQSASRRFASPCSRTVRTVTAVADPRKRVSESSEDNNTRTVSC
jgi:CARDB